MGDVETDARLGLSKVGMVARQLARVLLVVPEGGRIEPIGTYARTFRVGTGTVQKALGLLQEAGAVVIETHGAQGSVLASRVPSLLWQLADMPAVVGAMPLPNSLEFQGLSSGLHEAFRQLGIPFSPTYVHGSRQRLALLEQGRVDFMVVSAYMARQLVGTRWGLAVALELDPYTYYAKDSVVVVTRQGVGDGVEPRHAGLRVAIDRTSFDHEALTEAEFPGATYIQIPYPYIPKGVAEGKAEVAVWHQTALAMPLATLGLQINPVRREATLALSAAMGAAALLVAGGTPAAGILRHLERQAIATAHRRVTAMDGLPVL